MSEIFGDPTRMFFFGLAVGQVIGLALGLIPFHRLRMMAEKELGRPFPTE